MSKTVTHFSHKEPDPKWAMARESPRFKAALVFIVAVFWPMFVIAAIHRWISKMAA